MNYFWNSFYKKKTIIKPSSFAKYCYNNFLVKNKKILDIGCGNGRDSFYFEKKKLVVTGIDKSKVIIKKNILNCKNKNLKFLVKDINDKSFNKLGKYEYIYARFFLHTINQKTEKKLFSNLYKLGLKNKTIILMEFRTTKDPLFQHGKRVGKYETFTDHYRRFINVKKLINFLKNSKKFSVLKMIEKKGLAKFKNDNPVVCRLILKFK